ncbi:TPA_asm: hypothetical protein vir520_00055 [Caudoviricetes sp. vir520]|nr:TPA_asm: hypothetical protein vir520_00055 [Caudoviricetes sp. vir520]
MDEIDSIGDLIILIIGLILVAITHIPLAIYRMYGNMWSKWQFSLAFSGSIAEGALMTWLIHNSALNSDSTYIFYWGIWIVMFLAFIMF